MNSDITPQHSSFPTFTHRALIVVAIVGVALLAAGALATLFTGLLLLFAGVLLGVFLYESSRRLASAANLGYNAAFAMVVFAFVLLIGATFYFMGSQINQQASEFSEQFTAAVDQIQVRMEQQGWLKQFRDGAQEQQNAAAQQVLATATTAATGVVWAIGAVVLVLFLGFYFALQSNLYRSGLLKLLPLQSRPRVEEVLDKATQKLWRWILGRLAGMVLIGVSAAAGLWMMGVPLPITLGVIAGVLDFIPNIGPLIAAVPAVLFGFQQGPQMALYVAGFYLALQFVESYFITPLIDEQQVELPAGLILASQLLFGMMAGVLGLLLATPLTVVIYVFVRELYVKDTLGDHS
ncbi:MAG: AI-2E family transporter [Pirellulales bacterium]